jgi:hypothetical protein
MSKRDVPSGTRWQAELANELEHSGFGIICLTPNNLGSPWILFEAGAITKHIAGRACSLLFGGLKVSDVTGPLSQFQNRLFAKDEFNHLIRDINTHLDTPMPGEQLQMIFDNWWDRIEKHHTS